MPRPQSMTMDECAKRMTAFLAEKPRSGKTRAYLATLPKRPPVVVTRGDYPAIISRAAAKATGMQAERDAARYAAWEARGKPPSPSAPRKDRLRPRVQHFGWKARVLAQLLDAQEGRCCLCHEPLDIAAPRYEDGANLDHVVPRVRGGRDADNLLATHRRCNSEKGGRSPTGCEVLWLAVVNLRIAAPD